MRTREAMTNCRRLSSRTLSQLILMGAAMAGATHAQTGAPPAHAEVAAKVTSHFVGSESCKGCHAKAYEGWKQTRMANVVRDPKVHPEDVLGDFTHADPVRT